MAVITTKNIDTATAFDTTTGTLWRSSGGKIIGNPAFQGFYVDNGVSRIGVINFYKGIGTTLVGKKINKITLTVDIAAGTASQTRVITFYKSAIQGSQIDTTKSGPAYLGTKKPLGTIQGVADTDANTGSFTNQPDVRSTFVLDATQNSALFSEMAQALSAGDTTIIIYNGETTVAGSYKFSANYLSLSDITLTVEYEEGLVYIGNGAGFDAYTIHIHNGTEWEQYAPYIHNGTDWELYS